MIILNICFYFLFSSEIYCQDILKELEMTINTSNLNDSLLITDNIYSQLTDNIIFKMVVMSLICVAKLQDKGILIMNLSKISLCKIMIDDII